MADRGLNFTDEGGQIFIEPEQTRGMRTVITRASERNRVGLISYLYEVTNIVDDHKEAASFYTDAFGLDASRFSPIKSEQFGYKGTLTLFDPPARLDRIEITEITEPSLAMAASTRRRGLRSTCVTWRRRTQPRFESDSKREHHIRQVVGRRREPVDPPDARTGC
jgi:hypothetical protein